VGLFGKSERDKIIENNSHLIAFNFLPLMMKWCFWQKKTKVNVDDALNHAMTELANNMTGDQKDYFVKEGIKLGNAIINIYGQQLAPMDLVDGLTKFYDDAAEKIIAGIHSGISSMELSNTQEMIGQFKLALKEARIDYEKEHLGNQALNEAEKNSEGNALKAVVSCPSCNQKCRVKKGKAIKITCPNCSNVWIENF